MCYEVGFQNTMPKWWGGGGGGGKKKRGGGDSQQVMGDGGR